RSWQGKWRISMQVPDVLSRLRFGGHNAPVRVLLRYVPFKGPDIGDVPDFPGVAINEGARLIMGCRNHLAGELDNDAGAFSRQAHGHEIHFLKSDKLEVE